MKYQAVIGLEVHAQLLTESKIFCGCSTRFGAEPNSQTCPVCLGLPGALPVLNKKVVEYAIRAGLATNCGIAPTQYLRPQELLLPRPPQGVPDQPVRTPHLHRRPPGHRGGGGAKRIGITRIHMEEDAGKLVHGDVPGLGSGSGVDLNRACTPLLEIVSEPDMRSADEAVAYLKKLHQIVVYLGICDGNMEEGSFRCDANVSVMPVGADRFGTRTETKNVNSFRFVKQAIEYEIERQIEVIEDGGRIIQETRLFDPDSGTTRSMRGKEEAHDYRYFPDPDLVPLVISDDWVEDVRLSLPELPDLKRERYVRELGLSAYDAEVLTAGRELAEYFEACVAPPSPGQDRRQLGDGGGDPRPQRREPLHHRLSGYAGAVGRSPQAGRKGDHLRQDRQDRIRRDVEDGEGAGRIVEEKGLVQVSDTGAIEAIIDEVLAKEAGQGGGVPGAGKKRCSASSSVR